MSYFVKNQDVAILKREVEELKRVVGQLVSILSANNQLGNALLLDCTASTLHYIDHDGKAQDVESKIDGIENAGYLKVGDVNTIVLAVYPADAQFHTCEVETSLDQNNNPVYSNVLTSVDAANYLTTDDDSHYLTSINNLDADFNSCKVGGKTVLTTDDKSLFQPAGSYHPAGTYLTALPDTANFTTLTVGNVPPVLYGTSYMTQDLDLQTDWQISASDGTITKFNKKICGVSRDEIATLSGITTYQNNKTITIQQQIDALNKVKPLHGRWEPEVGLKPEGCWN